MNSMTLSIKIILVSQITGMICLWITNWVKSPIGLFIFFGAGVGLIGFSLFLWVVNTLIGIKNELFSK